MPAWVALWLLCAAAVAFIADARGRSGLLWLLIAIALTPLIALVLLACLPSKAPARLEREGKSCPRCAERVQRAARVCRFCGHTFEGS